MEPLLKIISLCLAALGGALGLFGEPREHGKLRLRGWVALALLCLGVIINLATEILIARNSALVDDWEIATEQPIQDMMLEIRTSRPMPLSEFADFLQKIRFVFALESERPLVRYLEFAVKRGRSLDLEGAFFLRTLDPNGAFHAEGRPGSLYYERSPGIHSVSVDKVWDSWTLPAVGIRVTIPFYKLRLGDEVRTVGDLAKLTSLSIYLPKSFAERPFIHFVIFTSDASTLFSPNVASLEYRAYTSALSQATVSGADLFGSLKREFFHKGSRTRAIRPRRYR